MFRNENNMYHMGGANVPHQPTMTMPAYTAPAYGYCPPYHGGNTFVLIVVLFILLIIVGATIYGNNC